MRHFGEHEGRQVLVYGYSKAKDSFMFSYTDAIPESDLRWIRDVLAVPAAASVLSAIEALDMQKHPASGRRGFEHAMQFWAPKNVSSTEIRLYDQAQSRAWFKESSNYLAPNERRAVDVVGSLSMTVVTPQGPIVEAAAPPLPHPIEAYTDRNPAPPIPVNVGVIDIPGVTSPPPAAPTYAHPATIPPAPPTPEVVRETGDPMTKAADALLQAVDKLSVILDIHARVAKMERAEANKKREAERKRARAAKAKPQQING